MIKKLLNKIFFPNTYSSDAYVKYLKTKKIKIGEGTWFVKPKKTNIDVQNSIFIEIGNDVCITEGVTILAHDWSYSVIAKKYGVAPGKQCITHVGNNVFIGTNSIILMGANIGDNVIIGAGSVVSGNIESNSVYAGNPAKRICSLDEQLQKLNKSFENSAYCYFKRYKDVYGYYPDLQGVGLYATLFVEKTQDNMEKYFSNSVIPFALKNMEKKYDTIEEFIMVMENEKQN